MSAPSLPPPSGNRETIENWNSILFEKFLAHRERVTSIFTPHSDALFFAHPPSEGARVLDVGCGWGDTTLALAKKVTASGFATGTDCSSRFLEVAALDARKQGISNTRFFVADAETDSLSGAYDAVYSRFGVMFFSNLEAALANMRGAMTKGGKFAAVVWRKKEDNELFAAPEEALHEVFPQHRGRPTGGPGPFAMADADAVSLAFTSTGFTRVTFERVDVTVKVGETLEDAVAYALRFGPAGEVMRLAGDEGVRRKDEVIIALKNKLETWMRSDGAYAKTSTWLVSAVA